MPTDDKTKEEKVECQICLEICDGFEAFTHFPEGG